MKKEKKIIIALVIALVLAIGFGATTYAMYRSSTTATGSIDTAAWHVEIDGTAFESATYTFDETNIHWTQNVGENDKIAPGATGYIDIPVDATGSEVGVVLTAALGSTTLPTGMTATLASGSDSQTIAYSASDMSATVRINIAWAGALSDDGTKDTSDKTAAGTSISIPVTLTARQVLPSA